MQDGWKVYMDSYMALNGLCFMVTWTVFKNHLLEVGPTQNRETMALRRLATIDLCYCIMCEDPQGASSASEQRGIMEVTMWLCVSLLLGL